MRVRIELSVVAVVLTALSALGTTPYPLMVSIGPNLERARTEGFRLIAGHPPLAVSFSAEAES